MFLQPGNILKIVAPYDRAAAGLGCLVGSLFGVTRDPVLSGAEVLLETVGVHEVAKVNAQAWTLGQKIYWDDTAKLFTNVSTSNQYVGVATQARANPTGTGFVKLNGFGT